MAKSKSVLTQKNSDLLKRLLRKTPSPRDALPYTDEFKKLKKSYEEFTQSKLKDEEFWHAVCAVAKQGIGRSERKRTHTPIPLTHDEQLELMRLFPDGIGGRDNLPYTSRFEDLHHRFAWLTNKKLTRHEFWRALVNVAKKSRKPAPIEGEILAGDLPEELIASLMIQNPWWLGRPWMPTQPVRRWAYTELVQRLDSGVAPIIAMRGTRQVGKSEIQKQLTEELLLLRQVPPSHILRVQFDETPTLGKFAMPVQAVVRWFEESILKEPINAVAQRGELVYLLFDELQNVRGWANQLKSLVDHQKVKIVATGSSALRITEGQDSLAGRFSMIDLGPLRLREIATIHFHESLPIFPGGSNLEHWTTPDFWRELTTFAQEHRESLQQYFKAFADLGGYPRCHNLGDAGLCSRFQLRDDVKAMIVDRTIRHDLTAGEHGRRRVDRTVETVFRQACRNTGQMMSPKKICAEMDRLGYDPINRSAAGDALDFLTDSLLLTEIPVLEAIGKKPTSSSKYCLSDHFIREALLQEQIPLTASEVAQCTEAVATQAGHLAESIVGAYLANLPGLEVSWLPETDNQGEIDYILTLGLRRIPIEVKYRTRMRGDETRHLITFCRNPKWEAPFGLVITCDTFAEKDGMIFLPLFALLAVR